MPVLLLLFLLLLSCSKGDPLAKSAETPPPPPRGGPAPGGEVMQRIQEYKNRLEKNPKDLEALIFLGNANFDIQRFEKAREYYEAALKIDGENVHVRADLASTLRNVGLSMVESGREMKNAAREKEGQRLVDRAIAELRRVLKASPDNEVALYNLGVILLNDRNDRQGAIQAWENLIRLKPTDKLSQELKKKIEEMKRS